MRLSVAAALLLIALFHALRITASSCNGEACDWYIPVSLLIPVAVLGTLAIGGSIAFQSALRARAARWATAIAATTALGVAGPPISLAVFRDAPDAVVVASTVLWLVGACGVLAYLLLGQRSRADARPGVH